MFGRPVYHYIPKRYNIGILVYDIGISLRPDIPIFRSITALRLTSKKLIRLSPCARCAASILFTGTTALFRDRWLIKTDLTPTRSTCQIEEVERKKTYGMREKKIVGAEISLLPRSSHQSAPTLLFSLSSAFITSLLPVFFCTGFCRWLIGLLSLSAYSAYFARFSYFTT